MMLVGGGSKFFYDYVPLYAGTKSPLTGLDTAYEFTTRDLGIPDGTTIEFIRDNEEKDIYTYVSPLVFRYESTSDPISGVIYNDSLVVWAENEAHADGILIFSYFEGVSVEMFHAKMRYSY